MVVGMAALVLAVATVEPMWRRPVASLQPWSPAFRLVPGLMADGLAIGATRSLVVRAENEP